MDARRPVEASICDFQGLEAGQRPEPRPLSGLEPDRWPSAPGSSRMSAKTMAASIGNRRIGLQSHFRGHLGIVAEGDEVLRPASKSAVFRQGAARLAHEPDRRPIQGFPAQGAKQAGNGGGGHAGLRASNPPAASSARPANLPPVTLC